MMQIARSYLSIAVTPSFGSVGTPLNQPKKALITQIHISGSAVKAIEHAVNLCVERGVKVEFVLWHTPAWASASEKEVLGAQSRSLC